MLCLAIKFEPNSINFDIPNRLFTVCLYPNLTTSPNVKKDLIMLVDKSIFLYNFRNAKDRNVYYLELKYNYRTF